MSSFKPDTDIPDLSGKVILVTGGNIGLGKESIYQLAQHNPSHIYLAARSKAKAEAAISSLQAALPSTNTAITFLELDLTSFASIKAAARTFRASSDRLDILINNAGIMATPPGLTTEGYELQFGTNHVGHALLTKLLIPTLLETTAQPGSDVRIVTLSSSAETWTFKDSYLFNDLKTDMRSKSTWGRYGQSKLANVHYSRALSRKYPSIKCIAVHPGSVETNLTSGPAASYPLFAWAIKLAARIVTVSVQTGALNQLWAATSRDAESGVFYYPVGLAGRDSALAKDEKLLEGLWEWTEKELEGHG